MSKRSAAIAILGALAVGVVLGIAWHEPRSMDLPDGIRTWVDSLSSLSAPGSRSGSWICSGGSSPTSRESSRAKSSGTVAATLSSMASSWNSNRGRGPWTGSRPSGLTSCQVHQRFIHLDSGSHRQGTPTPLTLSGALDSKAHAVTMTSLQARR